MDPAETGIRFASGLSARPDPVGAATDVCEQVGAVLGSGAIDLAMIFVSREHTESLGEIAGVVRRGLAARTTLGVSAEGVVGPGVELQEAPGVTLLAGRLPGVDIRTFTSDQLDPSDEGGLADTLGAGPDHRATILLADPFSVPVVRLLPAMSGAMAGSPGVLVGGMASAASSAGGNAIVLDDQLRRDGAVGVTLRGAMRMDTVVSQGCRPFGPMMIVTKARNNLIVQLGGRPAMQAVREAVGDLDDQGRRLLGGGLFVGRVVDEYKERFGRGDFLIRNVTGADEATGAIALADLVRPGQTVRLHVRDAVTADEDLALLLDGQKIHDRPAGGMLITCNGRGRRFFDTPNHDARAIDDAFRRSSPGGAEASDHLPLPLAGFFAAGEIGPIGRESYLHGHTACLALFRDPEPGV